MKRLLLFLIALCILTTSALAAKTPFADVSDNCWYTDAVADLTSRGCIRGVSAAQFDPQGKMTRAMAVTILYRLGGGKPAKQPSGFLDVPNGAWFTAAVSWAKANAIANGTGGSRFSPESYVTREQFVTFLWRYASMRYENDFSRFQKDLNFPDTNELSAWAQTAMRLSVGAGVIRGRDNYLAPKGLCSRAEAVTILHRFLALRFQEKQLPPPPEAADDALVYIRDYIPSIRVDLRYATCDNFTGQPIYTFTEPQLRYGTVKKLIKVEQLLRAKGFGLLIWDGYRPVSAQYRLWEVCPNSTYVANPNTGYSSHSRGNTIDLTLVTKDGGAVEMPSDFDDFSARADRYYSDVSAAAASNARLLEQIMIEAGFVAYSGEWWHYSDAVSYSVIKG